MENILRFLVIKTVRANTLYGAKFTMKHDRPKKLALAKEDVAKGPINEEEIDKTIEELVVE